MKISRDMVLIWFGGTFALFLDGLIHWNTTRMAIDGIACLIVSFMLTKRESTDG